MKKTATELIILFIISYIPQSIMHSITEKGKKKRSLQQLAHNFNFLSPSSSKITAPPIEEVTQGVSWYVSIDLRMCTNKVITNGAEAIEILGLIVDHYEGPLVLKPIVLMLYGVAGCNLKAEPRGSGREYKYTQESLIEFRVVSDHYKNEECNMNWSHTFGSGSNRITIRYMLKMKRSQRKGKDFLGSYDTYATNHKYPRLGELKSAFMVDRVNIHGSDIIFE